MTNFLAAEIALNKLVPSPENVRKTGASEGLGELAESIAAHGLLQSLIVKKAPRGKFAVVGGQRRHNAMNLLAKAGRLAKDHPVPCTVIAQDADAVEISLAENTVRMNMHPADQFEAWRDLIDRGNSVADIAARFGVTDRVVTQRMKLGRVAPALLDLYRQGELDLEQIMAFTLTDDHARQLKVWEEAQCGWQRNASSVRKALTRDEVPATDKRVRFVTLEAYEAAGGIVRRDLFDDENSGYVADTLLLDRLAIEKLAEAQETALFEGWKWVELRLDFPWEELQEFEQAHQDRVDLSPEDEGEVERLDDEEIAISGLCEEEGRDPTDDEQARLDEVERRKEELDESRYAYSPEVKAYAGAIVTLDSEGNPEIVRGLIRPGDAPKLQHGAAATKEKSPYSAALLTSLRDHKAAAVAAELAGNPRVALAAIVHDYALEAFYSAASGLSLMRLSAERIAQPKDSDAVRHLEKDRRAFGSRLPADKRDLWPFLLEQDTAMLAEILAQAVATAISTSRMDTLIEALGMDVRTWFTPTTENYFGRTGKQAILADIADMGVTVTGGHKLKKADLAAHAEIVLSRAENAAWLPVPMRAQAHEPAPAEAGDEDLCDNDAGSDDGEEQPMELAEAAE